MLLWATDRRTREQERQTDTLRASAEATSFPFLRDTAETSLVPVMAEESTTSPAAAPEDDP